MVLIDYKGDMRTVCWLDGSVLRRPYLEESYRSKLFKYDPDADRELTWHAVEKWLDDKTMAQLLGLVLSEDIEPRWGVFGGGNAIQVLFYMRPSTKDRMVEKYSSLSYDPEREEGERNRQMIIVCWKDFKGGKECAYDLIKHVGFKRRLIREIADYGDYRNAVLDLLRFVSSNYSSESNAVEDSLKDFGFTLWPNCT